MSATPRWDDLQLLLAVADAGSLLAAGRALGLSPATLSRRFTGLEKTLGRQLFERRRDGTRLTEAGLGLAETAREMEARLQSRIRVLPGDREALEGTLRVSAGDGFAEPLIDCISEFSAEHPRVAFELVLEARIVDLEQGEADLAIRTVRGRETALVYQRVAALQYELYASTAYLKKHVRPRTRAELGEHTVIGFVTPLARAPVIRALQASGASRFSLSVSTFGAYLAAVRSGLGIGALPSYYAEGLERVLPEVKMDPTPIYVCTHRDRRQLPHLRAFAAVVAKRFAAASR